jgi:NAD(P)H-flavin reductase
MHRVRARIVDLTDAAPGVRILGLVADGPFPFKAGQYAALSFRGGPWRDYSMANAPGGSRLEFHVREETGGRVSRVAVRELAFGDVVRVAGPFGEAYLRESHPGPILLAGGGTGLAPMLSIAKTALRTRAAPSVRLYGGVRRAVDLYAEAALAALMREWPNLSVVTALSDERIPGHRHGLVADAVAQDIADARAMTAYLAGPPAMVESVRAVLLARGIAAIHADPFVSEAERAARAARGEGPVGRDALD